MFTFIARMFGFVNRKEIDSIKTEVIVLRNDVIKLSNMMGRLSAKVDSLGAVVKQQSVTVDRVIKHQAELTMEFVTLMESLQPAIGRKNIQVGLPALFQGDDDDDLIN
jgi:hypothetical protein